MSGFWPSIVAIATAIVGLAVVAVVLSPKANTAGVIQAGTSGFAQDITAAVNPYSGGNSSNGGLGGGLNFGEIGGLLDGFGTSAHL